METRLRLQDAVSWFFVVPLVVEGWLAVWLTDCLPEQERELRDLRASAEERGKQADELRRANEDLGTGCSCCLPGACRRGLTCAVAIRGVCLCADFKLKSVTDDAERAKRRTGESCLLLSARS